MDDGQSSRVIRTPAPQSGAISSIRTTSMIMTALTNRYCSTCRWTARCARCCWHPDRNGHLYEIDRTNGEIISANPYGYVNSTTGIDLKTGRPIINPAKETKLGAVVHDICPTASGTKDWNPSAYSPRTGLPVYSARKSVHGLGERAGQLHFRHAVRRRERRHETRARRESRRIHGVGSGPAKQPPGISRRICRFGVRLGDRRGSGFLRHHGWLVQGRGCCDRRPEMAVSHRLRHRRPTDCLSWTRRQRICCRAFGCRRLGPAPSFQATSIRAIPPGRLGSSAPPPT